MSSSDFSVEPQNLGSGAISDVSPEESSRDLLGRPSAHDREQPEKPWAAGLEDLIRSMIPAGTIIAYGGAVDQMTPRGWAFCNGAAVARSGQYAELFSAIGTAWGAGDGTTTFNLPDLRGLFLRGVDHGAGRDRDAGDRTCPGDRPGSGNSGDAVGSMQTEQVGSHRHSLPREVWSFSGTGSNQHASGIGGGAGVKDTNDFGGTETRPKNAYVNYIVKL